MRAAGPPPPAAEAEASSSAAVRAQLERIIASPEFGVPERLRRFLQYIVEEALAGRADRIKAYTIGVEVFGRDEAFDPQNDPVVRIEAGRLRRALEHYYLTAGREDLFQIEIPKGAYVPHFVERVPSASHAAAAASVHGSAADNKPAEQERWWPKAAVMLSALAGAALTLGLAYWTLWGSADSGAVPGSTVLGAALPKGPVLLVAPFADLGGTPEAGLYATGLTEELLTQLAPFKEITVLGRETSRSMQPGLDRARLRQLGVDYVLEGSVRADGSRLRVTARLLNVGTTAVLWSQAYDEDPHVTSLFAIQQSVASEVATAVAQPYGIVFRADVRRRAALSLPNDIDAYACKLKFYIYRTEYSAEQHGPVRSCLERTVEHFPDYATGWAMLSFLYLDEDRFGFNLKADVTAPGDRALEAARRAVSLDPENPRALQGLMSTLFFRQEPKEALRVGEQALALNPNDTELLAEFGTRLAESGEWARGTALVEQALARNPAHSDYYRGILALCAYMLGDYDRAVAEIRRANLDKFPIYHAVAAIIYAELGMTDEAAQAGMRFARMSPKFIENLSAELAKRNFRPEDRVRLVNGLRKAGVPVPANAAADPGMSK